MKYQFWLRQLLLATMLVAAFLCIAKWCYIEYIDRIIPVKSKGYLVAKEDGHDRCNMLDVYVGRRVSFCGRYQTTGLWHDTRLLLGRSETEWIGEGAEHVVTILPVEFDTHVIAEVRRIAVVERLALVDHAP